MKFASCKGQNKWACCLPLVIIFLTQCGKKNETPESVPLYEIISEEKSETSNKAQLVEYAVYKDSIFLEDSIKKVMIDIYKKNRGKDVFKNYDSATVFAEYIFTSKEIAKNDKSAWIAMLSEGPDDFEPRLTFNDWKLRSLQGLNDNQKSEPEIKYENLKKYLGKRNLELCSFYNQIGEMELDCVHKADKKFPEFGVEHSKYANKLMRVERDKLAKKYALADSIFLNVTVYALSYCK